MTLADLIERVVLADSLAVDRGSAEVTVTRSDLAAVLVALERVDRVIAAAEAISHCWGCSQCGQRCGHRAALAAALTSEPDAAVTRHETGGT